MLIIKLRSANTAETRQYKKATKALLVLIPLLGITYLVVLMVPRDDSVSSHIITYLQAFLISTQVSSARVIDTSNVMDKIVCMTFQSNPFNRTFAGLFCVAALLFLELRSETGAASSMGNLARDTKHWCRCANGIS